MLDDGLETGAREFEFIGNFDATETGVIELNKGTARITKESVKMVSTDSEVTSFLIDEFSMNVSVRPLILFEPWKLIWRTDFISVRNSRL